MRPKSLKRLKSTPSSSPIARTRPERLDRHGEPTHPQIVKDPHGDLAPWGSCPEDANHGWDVEDTWAWVVPDDAGIGSTGYTFWYVFSDAEARGIYVRANSYVAATRLARTDPRGLPSVCAMLGITARFLQSVDIHDESLPPPPMRWADPGLPPSSA